MQPVILEQLCLNGSVDVNASELCFFELLCMHYSQSQFNVHLRDNRLRQKIIPMAYLLPFSGLK